MAWNRLGHHPTVEDLQNQMDRLRKDVERLKRQVAMLTARGSRKPAGAAYARRKVAAKKK